MRKLLLVLVAWAGLALLSAPVPAQEPSPELRAAAERVVGLVRGEGDPDAIFSSAFLAEVPAARLRALIQTFAPQYGALRGLGRFTAQSPVAGSFDIEFERATLHVRLVIEPRPPHRIAGLLFTGADLRGDSLAAVMAEIKALPGRHSVAVARLGDGPPVMLAGVEADAPLAIGSAFKLWILAELSRQVRAGERSWRDVVALDRASIPSGALHGWPRGAPVTLHTLAALMISQSDNSATDMLLHVLGRDNVERMMATIGVRPDPRNRPLLSTLELAAIKTAPAPAIEAWLQADEAERRRLLETRYAATDTANIDLALLGGEPRRIDGIEWFASAADLVRTMDWLRRNGDETALAILAINPGFGEDMHGDLAYVGYKGGSEPGVLNLTWLVRNRAGTWHVVTGSWNNPAAPVEAADFFRPMVRAVRLVREPTPS